LIPSRLAPPPLEAARVRALIFDLDGTLVDSYAAIAESLNHAREAFHLPSLSEAQVRTQVGRGLEALISDLVGPERVRRGVTLFRQRYDEIYATKTRVLPGVAASLETLADCGYPMTVASNKPARFGKAIVEELGLSPWLVSVHGPDTVGSTKPDPAMVRRCLQDMQVDAASAVYVGDMLLDVETAARASVPVILVEGGSSDAADLRATGQRCVAGLPELVELLQG
jgi:phosphoglycolate phosphatase